MSSTYFAKIVSIGKDRTTFVINKGSANNITMKYSYLIFELGDEILDPDTGESLGNLEIVKGSAKTLHIQEKMSTLISTEYIVTPERKETTHNKGRNSRDLFYSRLYTNSSFDVDEPVTETIIASNKEIKPLPNVKIGDYVRIISTR